MSNSEIGFGGLSDFEHIVDRGSLTSEQSQKIKRTKQKIGVQFPEGRCSFLESALGQVRDGYHFEPYLSRFKRLIGATATNGGVFDVVATVEAGNLARRGESPFQDVFVNIWANKEVFIDEKTQRLVCGLALDKILVDGTNDIHLPAQDLPMGLLVSRFTEVQYVDNQGGEEYVYGQQKDSVALQLALLDGRIEDSIRDGLSDVELYQLLVSFHKSELTHRLLGVAIQPSGPLARVLCVAHTENL